MLRRLLMGGVAASLMALNTGCGCVQSLLCHCWNELSPCHWGCDRAFGCHDTCEPCDEYGNFVGGCDSCGGGGCWWNWFGICGGCSSLGLRRPTVFRKPGEARFTAAVKSASSPR